MIDKKKLSRRFSRQAKTYDKYANVQKEMAQALLASCNDEVRTILEIGCGTGYLTQALTRAFPQARIHAIDLAPGMIDLAKTKVASQVEFTCCDFETQVLTDQYDLIISNATFQWFENIEVCLDKIKEALTPDMILPK
jgi:malonyl-CoA O-methyltransferase